LALRYGPIEPSQFRSGYEPHAITGKLRRKQKSFTVRGTRKDAEKKLADLLHAANHGTLVEPSKMTLGNWLTEWIEATKPRLRANSYTRYKVVEVAVPGREALKAAHPYFSIDDMRRRGELPDLVADFLAAWAYRQADQSYRCRRLKLDCGMIFRSTVPATWITSIDPHLASPEEDVH
jgi:hypothetical protein